MTPENWSDQVAPGFREWLRKSVDLFVGKNCDSPFIVHQYLNLLRNQWSFTLEPASPKTSDSERYQEKIGSDTFNLRDF